MSRRNNFCRNGDTSRHVKMIGHVEGADSWNPGIYFFFFNFILFLNLT